MGRRWLVAACAIYALALLAIVAIANVGGTHAVFGVVTRVPYGDKIGHFVLLGGLALSLDLAWRRDLSVRGRPLSAAAATIAALALIEELTQIALPTRSFDLLDLAADLVGIAAFVGAGRLVRARLARQRAVAQ